MNKENISSIDLSKDPIDHFDIQNKTTELTWLLNGMLNAFVIFDPVLDKKGSFVSYRFVYINKAYEEITGVQNNAVRGKTIHEVWPGTEESWVEKYGHVSLTGETLVFNNYHEPTQKLYHCRVFRPWKHSQRFCVVFDDITEIENTRDFYENILESIGDGVWVSDENDIIFYANERMGEIAGVSPQEIIGKNILKDFPKETIDGMIKEYHEAKKFHHPMWYDIPVITPAGRKTWQNGWLVPRLGNGKYEGMICTVHDNTKEKEFHISLNKSEKQLKRAQKIGKMGCWQFNLDNRTIDISDEAYDIYGLDKDRDYTIDNVQGIPLKQYRRLLDDTLENLIEGKSPYDIEFKIKRPSDGKILNIHSIAEYNPEENSVFGVIQDITDQKKNQKKLLEQKLLLDSIIDESPLPTWIANEKGLMVRCNQALLDTLNLKKVDLLHKYNVLKDNNLKTEGHLPLIKEVFNKYHTVKFTQFWEVRKIGIPDIKAGRDVYIDATLFPIVDTKGKLQYVVCQWIDISEQKHAEEKIIEEQNYKESILSNMQTGVYIYNIKTSSNDYINSRYTTITGWSLEEINSMGKDFYKLFHPDDLEKISGHMKDIYTSKKAKRFSVEYRFKTKSGKWIWCLSYDTPYKWDSDGNAALYIGSFIDITKRKQAENELNKLKNQLEKRVEAQTKELKEKIAELERFRDTTIDREFRIKELKEELKVIKENK